MVFEVLIFLLQFFRAADSRPLQNVGKHNCQQPRPVGEVARTA